MNTNTLIAVALGILVVGGGAYWLLTSQKSEGVITNPMVTSGENPQPGSQVHDLPVEPAAAAARKDLAAKLGAEEKSIVILRVTDETWSDGCLGLGGPAESCLQALVPGFSVELLASGKSYIYRTDQTGAALRLQP